MKKYRKGKTVLVKAKAVCTDIAAFPDECHFIDLNREDYWFDDADVRPLVTKKVLAKFWDDNNLNALLAKNSPTFKELCELLGVR